MSTKAPYSIRWWLIRHAPVINPDDVAYGSMDLDATFEAMGPRVQYLRAMLPSPANVRTSALVRSQQTLHSVWPDAEIYPDAAWNEQSLGAWEGQPRSVIYGPNGPVRALFDDPKNFRPPSREDGTRDGESWLDLVERVAGSLEDAEQEARTRDEVVFCHAGTIRAAIAHSLNLDPDQAFGFVVDNMSLTRIDSVHFHDRGQWHRRWRFGGINLGPAA